LKNFVLIGAAGYIAPKHLKAIKDTGNRLLAAVDKNDSVGVLDTYFPCADFFTEFERFDRYCEKLKRSGTPVDYVSVCTPNYLHDAHSRFGLRLGADVICEKPVVLNPWNVDALVEMELETGKHIYSILQLRLHPAIGLLKQKIASMPVSQRHTVELKYITPRGRWYHRSWKGDAEKSGGIVTNIGLHFFDVLLWIFGEVKSFRVNEHTTERASGSLVLERADVNWFLSINETDLPSAAPGEKKGSYRSLIIDKEEYEFSNGFEDLHTKSYEELLAGRGNPIRETRNVVQLMHDIRNAAKK
jgi:UDP-N-acetyl-2-amino-2-deoxyglucuronate dehydrogenase